LEKASQHEVGVPSKKRTLMHDGKMTQKGEFHQQKLESKARRVGNLSSKNWELKQENSELKQLNGFTNIVLFL